MADEASFVGTSSCQVMSENPESSIEINIKTLDSKIYTIRVDKNIPVMMLKAKLVDVSGVPAERQRLIFRGKVLKDDHLLSEYQLDDGHTLHLVARQSIEGQTSSATDTEGTTQGNDSTTSAPRSRVGQVSHSVLLGTVNVADQGESLVTDIGRLVGAVLGSLGVGNVAPSAPAGGMPSSTAAAPSNVEAERNLNSIGSSLSGNPPPAGFTVLSNPFQSLHLTPQVPSAGFLSRHMTIPDALTTLSEFISRMELALQDGGPQPIPNNLHDPPRTENSSSSARGLPTPEMLRTVMEQAQLLLRDNATAALSRVTALLEREGTSTDTVVRSQIQAEAMHVGAAMQHLGALLLELGRVIMTLRMGQSPADSAVNAGPAVYISSTGPNPIMVQPFPLQTNSLFGVSPSPFVNGVPAPVPTGDPSRNINIHIHAGSPLIPGVSNAAARTNSGDAAQGERSNGQQASRDSNSTGGSVAARGPTPRTVVAAIPARPTAQTSGHVLSVMYPVHVRSQLSVPITMASAQVSNPTVSSGAQPMYSGVRPPPSESGTLSNIVAQISAQVINALGGAGQGLGPLSQGLQSTGAQDSQEPANALSGSQVDQVPPAEPSAVSGSPEGNSSSSSMQLTDSLFIEAAQQALPGSSSDLAEDDGKDRNANIGEMKSAASVSQNAPVGSIPTREGEELPRESSGDPNLGSTGGLGIDVNSSATTSTGEISSDNSCNNNLDFVTTSHTSQTSQRSETDRSTPLGLGLGGLQPKRRCKTAKRVGKDKVSLKVQSVDQDQQSIARGQQFLHSFLTQSSSVDGANTNGPSNSQTSIELPLGRRRTNGEGQVDAADMMSQILQTPVFNNLLTGVAEQTGIGSPNDLRSMLEQCTQSPAVRNTLNGIAQQVEGQAQHGEALFPGTGSGQGGLDFSRMIQQIMPVLSQALGRGSTHSVPPQGSQHNSQTQCDDGGSCRNDMQQERNFPVDLGHAVEMIEHHDTPERIFRLLLQGAGHLFGEGDSFNDLVSTLVDNEELTSEFMSMLCRDLHRRMRTDQISEQ